MKSSRYPVTLKFDEATKGYAVSFVDIPEAITLGDTIEEALAMAADALLTAMDFYFEDRRPVPMPSNPAKNQHTIKLPASVWAKVLLLNEVCTQNLRPVDIARLMGVRPQEVNRILDLHYATKIDTIEAALKAIGKELKISVI